MYRQLVHTKPATLRKKNRLNSDLLWNVCVFVYRVVMLPTDMPNLLLPQLLHTVTGKTVCLLKLIDWFKFFTIRPPPPYRTQCAMYIAEHMSHSLGNCPCEHKLVNIRLISKVEMIFEDIFFSHVSPQHFINNRYIHNTMNNVCLISKQWRVILAHNCMELADVCPFDPLFIFWLAFPKFVALSSGFRVLGGGIIHLEQNTVAPLWALVLIRTRWAERWQPHALVNVYSAFI